MSDAGNGMDLPRAERSGGQSEGRSGGARPGDLIGILEERVSGLVDRYRGSQKGAEELRARLDAAESEIAALHARIEESSRLRDDLRDRVLLLIDQVRKLESTAPVDQDEAEAEAGEELA